MSGAEYFKPAKEAVNGFINIQNTWAFLTMKKYANHSARPGECPLVGTRLCGGRGSPQDTCATTAGRLKAPRTCMVVHGR